LPARPKATRRIWPLFPAHGESSVRACRQRVGRRVWRCSRSALVRRVVASRTHVRLDRPVRQGARTHTMLPEPTRGDGAGIKPWR
jgi:hypothetical protein